MGTKKPQLPTDKLIGMVMALTEEVLEQSDKCVDFYRSAFFSGNNPTQITERLGDLGSELVKLADVCIALSTLQESVESYESVLSRIQSTLRGDTDPPPPTFIKPYPRPLMTPLEDV